VYTPPHSVLSYRCPWKGSDEPRPPHR
jgi:hypothetical protein